MLRCAQPEPDATLEVDDETLKCWYKAHLEAGCLGGCGVCDVAKFKPWPPYLRVGARFGMGGGTSMCANCVVICEH
eukprot:14014657-Alexandrium_andersonii.AAC.1